MKKSLNSMISRIEEIDEGGIWESSRGTEKVRGIIDLWEVLIIIVEVCIPGRYPSDARPKHYSSPLCSITVRLQAGWSPLSLIP